MNTIRKQNNRINSILINAFHRIRRIRNITFLIRNFRIKSVFRCCSDRICYHYLPTQFFSVRIYPHLDDDGGGGGDDCDEDDQQASSSNQYITD